MLNEVGVFLLVFVISALVFHRLSANAIRLHMLQGRCIFRLVHAMLPAMSRDKSNCSNVMKTVFTVANSVVCFSSVLLLLETSICLF